MALALMQVSCLEDRDTGEQLAKKHPQKVAQLSMINLSLSM